MLLANTASTSPFILMVKTVDIATTLNFPTPEMGVKMVFFSTVVLMSSILIRDIKENCTIWSMNFL